ncbi:MAG: hypothetical protein FWD32_01725, partial [Firmicutes bacterium]|nr:hypothetical protein [Bacillota bacterium]
SMGISLLITIPLSNLAIIVYYNVFYYTATKRKYFINHQVYVCPAEEVLTSGIGANLTSIDVVIEDNKIKEELKGLDE